jgi:hypothetical protein
MLRTALIVLSAAVLVVAIGLIASGATALSVLAVWIGIQAAIVLVALLAERGRYAPSASNGPWIRTAERFRDPTSERWIIVEYNPRTGERRYVEEP